MEARVMVECVVCGLEYDCSARTHRDIRSGKVEPRCGLHRTRKPRPQTVPARHRRFWLERFTLDEIQDMAIALWPLPSQRAPMIGGALTASGAPPGPPDLGGR